MGSTSNVELLELPTLKKQRVLETKLDQVHDLALSPDERFLLASGGTAGETGIVELWDLKSVQSAKSLTVASDVIYRVAWRADGTHFCTAGADGLCSVFSISQFNNDRNAVAKPLVTFSGHSKSVLSVQYLDNLTIASMGADQTIRLWQPEQEAKLLRVLDNHVDKVLASCIQPRNNAQAKDNGELQILATSSDDKTVRFWQPSVGRLLRFVKLPSVAQSICWSLDGQFLYAGCRDGKIRVIDFRLAKVTGEVHSGIERVYELVAIDSKTIALGGEGGVKLEISTTNKTNSTN